MIFKAEIERLNAIGIRTDRLDAMQVYELNSALIGDPALSALTIHASTDSEYLAVVKALSPAEKLSLRERITGVIKLPTKQLGPTTRAEVR